MTEETTDLAEALEPTETPEEAAQETPAEPAPEEVKPDDEPKGKVADNGNITVPLAALLEVRDGNKALKAELENLKQASQPAPEPETVPDPIDDPQGFAEYTQRQIQAGVGQAQQQFNSRLLDMSEASAIKTHGADKVDAVKEWFATQPPSVQQDIQGQADPYDYAIQQHQRETMTATLTADPEKLDRILKLLEGKETPAPTVPGTTATHQSVGARKGPEWGGPTPLEDIFKE